MINPIVTAQVGRSEDIFPNILRLYAQPGVRVLDVTYGRGNFWHQVQPTLQGSPAVQVTTLDYLTKADIKGDFRELPIRAESFDVVVLDPPYGNQGGEPSGASYAPTYNLQSANTIKHVLELYWAAMLEAYRVLRSSGVLIVKCQDAIESGKQRRVEHEISLFAEDLDLIDLDTFIQVNPQVPVMRHNYQLHARKNHSYYRVWQKC